MIDSGGKKNQLDLKKKITMTLSLNYVYSVEVRILSSSVYVF